MLLGYWTWGSGFKKPHEGGFRAQARGAGKKFALPLEELRPLRALQLFHKQVLDMRWHNKFSIRRPQTCIGIASLPPKNAFELTAHPMRGFHQQALQAHPGLSAAVGRLCR